MKEELVIALDIGGTHTKAGLVNREGKCLLSTRFDTPSTNFQDFLKELEHSIAPLQEEKAHRIVGLSVAVPSVNVRGFVLSPPNLPWPTRTPLVKHLEKKFGYPTLLLNDANAAALGELAYGAAQGLTDFVYITLGTGLGSAVVANGELIKGAKGVATEMGHMCFRKSGRRCTCGKRGCLETYVSATALRRTFLQLCSEEHREHTLYSKKIGYLKTKSVIKAAKSKDPTALQAVEQTGKWLGEALANVATLTGPSAIFIAGGLAKSASLFLPIAKQALEEEIYSSLRSKVELQVSSLLVENPAVLGAAYYFFKNQQTSSKSSISH